MAAKWALPMIWMAVGVACHGIAAEAADRNDAVVRILLFADPHLVTLADGASLENNPEAFPSPSHKPFHEAHARFENLIQQANQLNPDAVLGLGDFVGNGGSDGLNVDYARFVEIYARLDEHIPAYLTIGNHEYDYGTTYDQIKERVGYAGREENAGSVFNYWVDLEKAGLNVRIIMMDSNFDRQRRHSGSGGHYGPGFIEWFDRALDTDANVILLAGHHTIHSFADFGYFSENDAASIAGAVARSGKRVHHIGAHTHPWHRTKGRKSAIQYDNLGERFPGYTVPAVISPGPAHYVVLEITAAGDVRRLPQRLRGGIIQ